MKDILKSLNFSFKDCLNDIYRTTTVAGIECARDRGVDLEQAHSKNIYYMYMYIHKSSI